jgi:hypothetical protein
MPMPEFKVCLFPTLFYMSMYETPEAPMPTSSGKTLSNKTMLEFLKNHFDP